MPLEPTPVASKAAPGLGYLTLGDIKSWVAEMDAQGAADSSKVRGKIGWRGSLQRIESTPERMVNPNRDLGGPPAYPGRGSARRWLLSRQACEAWSGVTSPPSRRSGGLAAGVLPIGPCRRGGGGSESRTRISRARGRADLTAA